MSHELYVPIWKKTVADIIDMLDLFPASSSIQLAGEDFKAAGDRDHYGFRLELLNGKVVNNIEGSAVARDLFNTMLNFPKGLEFLSSKHVTIRMNENFTLLLQQEESTPNY